MKLPEKKYEPKHNYELRSYAKGWNMTLNCVECWCSRHGDKEAKEMLLEAKEAYEKTIMPYYKGVYYCAVEIERLNEEEQEKKMSKQALLVIDINDELLEDYENFYVDYDLRADRKKAKNVNESIKYVEKAELKPLPQKKIDEEKDDLYNVNYKWGFNDCLDEILGETK